MVSFDSEGQSRTLASAKLLAPEVLSRIAHLHIAVSRRVTGAIVGRHRSPLHGSSIEFAEHKEYSPGDEIRHIDWKAFGRFDKYYVKRFEDETNLRIYLLVDCSGSMGYGAEGGAHTKLEYAKRLAASVAFMLLRQQDSVGLIAFNDSVVEYVPARSKSSHLEDLCRVLVKLKPKGETGFPAALEHAIEHAGRRSLILILSDFFQDSGDSERLQAQLARRHEVGFFQVLDRAEIEFPFDRLTLFQDMEGPAEVLAEPHEIRDAYLEHFEKFRDSLRRNAVKNGIDYHLALTDETVDQFLVRYVTARANAGGGGRAL